MIVEIRDMPNQNIKSVDIHIDFQNSENNHTSVNFSKKNEKSVDVSEKILENGNLQRYRKRCLMHRFKF